MEELLAGKKILIVDDEPDILETLKEILDMCLVDSAPDFERMYAIKIKAIKSKIFEELGKCGEDNRKYM